MTLEKRILARIKTEKVKPKTRGYFVVRDTGIWVLVLICVAVLGLSFGMVIFSLFSADTSLISQLGLSAGSTIPYFWISIALIVGAGSYLGYRSTRRGYRVNLSRFLIIAGLIAIGTGGLVYALRIAEYVDTVASENVPIYNVMVPLNTSIWFDPDRGLLSGTVRSRESDDVLILRDQDLVIWTIDASDIDINDPRFQAGERVKLIGDRTGPDSFKAKEIHPWRN